MEVETLQYSSDCFHLDEGVFRDSLAKVVDEVECVLSVSYELHEIHCLRAAFSIVVLDFLFVGDDSILHPIDEVYHLLLLLLNRD